MILAILAETPLERFEPSAIGMVVLWLVSVLSIIALVLTVINQWRILATRKHPDDLSQLQIDLAKLPDEKKFEALAARFSTCATIDQFKHCEHMIDRAIHDFGVPRGERLAAHETAMAALSQRITAIESKNLLSGDDLRHQLDKVTNQVNVLTVEMMKRKDG